MKITKSQLKQIIKEELEEMRRYDPSQELDAILDEAKKGKWPKKLKKGRFTKYCKRQGFERGPGIGCAEKAMDSDSASVRGMASFYMNTVKKEGCGDLEEGVKTLLDQVKEDLGPEATKEEIAAELEKRAMASAARTAEEPPLRESDESPSGAQVAATTDLIRSMYTEDALEEAEMSGDLSGVPAEGLAALMADAMTEPEVEAAIKDPLERMIMDVVEKVMAKFSA